MRYKTARSLIIAGCLLTILNGCSGSSEPPIARVLPPAPDFARPVYVAPPKTGESAIAVAARERSGRLAANGRLRAFRDWYEALQKAYSE